MNVDILFISQACVYGHMIFLIWMGKYAWSGLRCGNAKHLQSWIKKKQLI